ncbi:MAG: hypothetical protein F6K47_25645 [Symploca sp. SIO2E6]|nr:hypothetical protein [Symploca sp. SIO2E6]
MTNSQLTATLKHYEAAIETLQQSQSVLLAEEVLSILNRRDALQVALQEAKYLQQAISLNADNAQAHLYLGVIYEEYQEVDKAQKQYRIATGGDLPGAYNSLLLYLIMEKRCAYS